MSEQIKQNELRNNGAHGTVATYIAGFVLSVVLTLIAYILVVNQAIPNHELLLGVVIGLAVVQFIVQMVFFLHVGRGRGTRFNLVVLAFMLIVLLILVLGTLWIMHDLDYNLMPPEELERHIIEDEGY